MSFFSSTAAWIFYSGSAEDRHLIDIVNGVSKLQTRGVLLNNCYVFMPFINATQHQSLISVGVNVFDCSNFNSKFVKQTINAEQLVFIGTGHGNALGLVVDIAHSNPQSVSPWMLLDIIRSINNLQRAAVVLGQCCAGIFNFTEAKGNNQPEICIIGATNFDSSISADFVKSFPNVQLNLFLYYFFEWISNPLDLDGDGKLSLLDAYKYASVGSNETLHRLRLNLYLKIENQKQSLKDKEDQYRARLSELGGVEDEHLKKSKFEIESLYSRLTENLETLYNRQEPWVLHANYGRTLLF